MASCVPGGFDEAANLADYRAMQLAIDKTGRPMVLSIEGGPPIANCSAGGHGNMRRVGTDIKASWYSMIGLMDGGSGLHEFAHNATGFATGGFWNDLDMLEIGNGVFHADVDAARAHLSAWIICKAPLLMGSDLRTLRPEILKVLLNKEAIAILKDPLGVQGRRVKSVSPDPVVEGAPEDNQVLLTACNETDPLQRWRFNESLPGPPDGLYVQKCDATNAMQRWNLSASGLLRNMGAGLCVVAGGDPVRLEPCNSSVRGQIWQFSNGSATQTQSRNSTSGFLLNGPQGSETGQCLNLPWGRGPDVQLYRQQTNTGGQIAPNEFFFYDTATHQVVAQSTVEAPHLCLVASAGIGSGGVLWTVDATGANWCVVCGVHSEGGECDSRDGSVTAVRCENLSSVRSGKTWSVSGGGNVVTLRNAGSKSAVLGFSDGQYNSGPLPFSRYAAIAQGDVTWSWPHRNSSGSQMRPANHQGKFKIWWNNNTGSSTQTQEAGNTCLTLTRGGNHEVWLAPLVGGRLAIALLNRDGNRANATLTVRWEDIGLPPMQKVEVRSIWADTRQTATAGEYSEVVSGHGVALLVLTPQN